MIKLIAFDLDGTVFDDHKKIHPAAKEILERAAGMGIEIVPATGRPYKGLCGEVEKLQGIRYVLTTNGGGIYERETGKCIYQNCMKLDGLLRLLTRLEELDVMADAFVQGDSYMTKKKVPLIDGIDGPEEIKDYIRTSRTVVEDQAAALRERGDDVEKLTINFAVDNQGRRIDYEKAWKILEDFPEFHPVSGGMQNIEVTAGGVTKASALLWLGEYLKIKSEEMIAFGDSGNDVDMLRAAGTGVAMGNAEKEAKAAADYITTANTEGGIVHALKKFIPELAQPEGGDIWN